MLKLVFLWALLGTSSVPVAFGSLSDTVPKCCENYQVLDPKKQLCQLTKQNAYNFTTTREATIFQTTNSFLLQCPNGLDTFTVPSDAVASSYVTVPGSNRTLSNGELCIVNSAQNVTTLAYCKAINKCCPPGQVLHSSLRKCVPAQDAPINDRITREDGTSLSFAHDFSGNDYHVKFCVSQLLLSSDGIEFDYQNGTVITESFFNQARNSKYYCLDSVIELFHNEYRVVAMVANSKRALNHYTNFRKIFPHFCFASSVFLLLTIIYHCAIPKLRQNVHGYSMICFLFSMMIVQIDIGMSFILNHRSCICTYIPYHRSFFRYASSAWTTVMGYITWGQLKKSKNQSTRRRTKKLTFALFSCYAWGLSLALVTAAVTYDYFHPLTSICWWGTRHVKMFMDTPNITLQLLNNIFFIPSMMHICKNLQLTDKSGSKDANELKNKKKRAVIKKFAIMQSTKLAEILFSIRTLFDIRSGVYLMFAMCSYATIGPLMFCALVDVKAFFTTELGRMLHNGFQSTFYSSTLPSQFRAADRLGSDPSKNAGDNPCVQFSTIRDKSRVSIPSPLA